MADITRKPRISIEVEPDLRRRLRIAAARRDITMREYVLTAVEQALSEEESLDWTRLSEPAFARDWDSASDAVYDAL